MARLCERPGCSDPAEVSYGFDADHLVVWLGPFGDPQSTRSGVLCLRHANAMVVPLGWMLDDRREPVPRLFRPPVEEAAPQRRRAPRPERVRDDTEQLLLDPAIVMAIPEEEPIAASISASVAASVAASLDVPVAVQPAVGGEAAEGASTPWQPLFDDQDDLSGLLQARGRLLSRAFRGAPHEP